jgi:hypothetical protein
MQAVRSCVFWRMGRLGGEMALCRKHEEQVLLIFESYFLNFKIKYPHTYKHSEGTVEIWKNMLYFKLYIKTIF